MRVAPNPPKGLRWFNPHLYYEDVAFACNWLQRVFGFEPGERAVNSKGKIDYAEMTYKGEAIILSHGRINSIAKIPQDIGANTQHILVYVDNIQTHYQHSLDQGADCIMQPEYQYWGDLLYRVYDCAGHLWTFAQHVKDVSESDLIPPE